jgi:hypothetical protein
MGTTEQDASLEHVQPDGQEATHECKDLRMGGSEMKVLVAFEFEGVDPNSPEADEIVQQITESCETMRIGFDANACWVDDAVATKGEEE